MRKASVVMAVLCLFGVLLAIPPAAAEPTGYVEMSDGTQIAVNVRMPDGHQEGTRYPAIFEMSGYDGGSADGDDPTGGQGSRGLTHMFEGQYVTVHASVRGTGCSEGEFDLFSWRSALDGREVIEWMARQPWSNGEVGIYGHSYGGITGFMVAATQPPSLEAVSVSGLIDDLYRGIVYPGGVSNYGFPLLWTGVIRPVYDIGGGSFDGMADGDAQCGQNTTLHTRTILNDPILQGIQDTDNSWWRARALMTYAERIKVPIHITGAYQDEQTGPRGPYHLFEMVRGVPKRLLITNGDHGTQTGPDEIWQERKAWLDHWMLGIEGGFGKWRPGSRNIPTSVSTRFEMVDGASNGTKRSRTFPLEDTRWTNVYLHEDSALDLKAPTGDEAPDVYVSGSPRQSWVYQAGHTAGSPVTTEDGPDELTYSTAPFKASTAVVGPITANLFMSSTAIDTEVFVQLIDEGPDGSRYYITRGMLKASHRAISSGLSDWTPDHKMIYRPHRPHTNPEFITPAETYDYLIEIFPVGHIFRPGHKLVVKIHTPPLADSYYFYVPKRFPGINTVLHDKENPSHLTIPIVSLKGVKLGPEPAPCTLQEVRCIPG